MKKLMVPATLAAMLCFLLSPNVTFGFSGSMDNKALYRLAEMRVAGLRCDRSQISNLRDILKNPYPDNRKGYLPPASQLFVITALRALTRLGAAEAVPDIDQLIADSKDCPEVANYAKVQKARLLAENSAQGITNSKAHALAVISRFYSVLGLSSTDLNAGVKQYQHQLLTEPQGAGNGTPVSVEVYAVRELADMAYQRSYQDFLSLPGVSQIDFSLDYPSALKLRLVPLSREARIETLIEALVNTRILGRGEDYDMQLLADEGLAASPAIAAQLNKMKMHRSEYQENNFSALFRVLSAIGDQEQAPVVARFVDDPDINVRSEAELISHNLQSGSMSLYPRAAGY